MLGVYIKSMHKEKHGKAYIKRQCVQKHSNGTGVAGEGRLGGGSRGILVGAGLGKLHWGKGRKKVLCKAHAWPLPWEGKACWGGWGWV